MLPVIFYILLALLILLVAGIIVVVLRALAARPVQETVEPARLPAASGLDLAARLAEIVQCETVSFDRAAGPPSEAFLELHEILRQNYPLVHARLALEKVNKYSLLYTWPGSRPELQPVLLAAHLDVVPADESTAGAWPYPPFSGAIAGDHVWGRGTLDIKCQVSTLLDAAELLLERGYQPARTLYLAFGHDEEIGGMQGAAAIARRLRERGVQLAAVLDEGGGVIAGPFPGIDLPVALVGVAEKGSLTLELCVESAPGHSSAPPAHTSIGILARAIQRLEARPMPGSLRHAQPLLQAIAPHTGFLVRLVFANLWLFGGFVRRSMETNPQANALLRTTTAVTMISGGVKTNILPPRAAAQVNYRLAPGDSIGDVIEHTRRAVNDSRVKINQPNGNGRTASPVSPAAGSAYRLLSRTIRQVFERCPVSPFLVTGATDSRHYTPLCRNVYRFSPMLVNSKEMIQVHGIGERISLANLERMLQFFSLLLQAWGDADDL